MTQSAQSQQSAHSQQSGGAQVAGGGREPALVAVRWAMKGLDFISEDLAGRVAHRLYFLVRRRRPARKEAEVLAQARRTSVVHGGVEVPVYEWGQGGDAVLFIHGWEGYGAQVAAFVAPLRAAGLRVVTFDAPGHGHAGGSTTNTLEFAEIARQVAERRGPVVAVVAHSFGALVAARYLQQVPDGARCVAIIGGVYSSDTLLEGFRRITGASDRVLRQVVSRTERAVGGRWSELSGESMVPGQRLPALIIHDRDDREVPVTEGERYGAEWKGATLELTEGLGHRRILTKDAVVERVVAFVREHAGGVGSA